jgi:hypothetical protein
MLNKDQSQDVGNNASAIQAGGSVTLINVGPTLSEVRAIALDVAKATFYELSGEAKQIATIRVEEITDQIIKKLEKEFPAGLQKANDPDFQHALFTVQKEYARNGDKELGDLLVDLLVDRSKHNQRDILQIVLNESLSTAPKLTDNHLAALAVIFLFRYTQRRIANHKMFGEYLDKQIYPFVSLLPQNDASYQHLEFTSCGSKGVGSISLERALGVTYTGLFTKGFDQSEIANRAISVGQDSRFFIPCLNDSTKLQINANRKATLEEYLDEQVVLPDDKAKILELFDFGNMDELEIREKVISIRPYMLEVFEIWNNSPMQKFTLTSVGMAIGHANIKRLVGEFADLSIWIN